MNSIDFSSINICLTQHHSLTIQSVPSLHCSDIFAILQETVYLPVYFWILDAILLAYLSIIRPVPHYLNYKVFTISFGIWYCKFSNFVFPQDSLSFTYTFLNKLDSLPPPPTAAMQQNPEILIGIVVTI